MIRLCTIQTEICSFGFQRVVQMCPECALCIYFGAFALLCQRIGLTATCALQQQMFKLHLHAAASKMIFECQNK